MLNVTRVCFLSPSSLPLLQSKADAPAEQEEGLVHLAAVRREHRPADHDPHLAQLSGGLHQQLPLQLGRQQLLRTPVGRRDQVWKRFTVGQLENTKPELKSSVSRLRLVLPLTQFSSFQFLFGVRLRF